MSPDIKDCPTCKTHGFVPPPSPWPEIRPLFTDDLRFRVHLYRKHAVELGPHVGIGFSQQPIWWDYARKMADHLSRKLGL